MYGFEDDSRWEVPRTLVQDGETLREAAQRCLQEIVGDSIETFIFSNAPCAHKDTSDDRTFYMLGIVLDGDVVLKSNSPVADYAWLKRSELAESYREDPHMSGIVDVLLEE
jgi:ADP-ribose pyrophosphatase YjhB (NUDIX family)